MPISSSEAHLDLLLAEELSVNPVFLRRFIAGLWSHAEAPKGGELMAVVRLNDWDEGGPDCVAADGGENDIDMTVTDGVRTLRVMIEDKVWAVFQPDQGGRYARRARSRGDGTVLVAPRSRLDDPDHAHNFQIRHAIEDLATWLDEQATLDEATGARRLRWRAALLRQLCQRPAYVAKPDHPPTVAFTAYCVQWLAEHEPRAMVDAKSLRTQGSGWLWFTSPSGLVYKASNGRVDLYVSEHGFAGTADDLAAAVATGWGPEDFVAAADTSGNPVLRFEHPDAKFHSQDGVPADRQGLLLALNAAASAVRWVSEQGDAVNLPVV